MPSFLVIGLKDLRQRLRDRSALMVAFVGPIMLASIISLAFGGGDELRLTGTWALVDDDRSELSAVFGDEVLRGSGIADGVDLVRPSGWEEAHALVEAGGATVAFHLPEGFEQAVRSGMPAEMTVVTSRGSTIGGAVAEALAKAYADQVEATRLSVLAALRAGEQPPDLTRIPDLAATAALERMPVSVIDTGVGEREFTGANYFGPSMAIFFLFFTVGFGARSLLAERQNGTLSRLLAAPIPRWSVVAGKSFAVFVLGLASMTTMFVFMSLAFGTRWGDPAAVVVLTVVTVAAVIGVVAVVQTFARNDQQADAYGSIVGVGFALLGGNFFPLHQLPDAMRQISLLTPNGWALRGFTDLVYEGGGVGDVGANIAAVALFAVVAGGLALLRIRRGALA